MLAQEQFSDHLQWVHKPSLSALVAAINQQFGFYTNTRSGIYYFSPILGFGMATVSFPSALRGAIQTTKRRGQLAGYRQSDAAGGPPYFERFSDDVPTVWQFSLVFTRAEAQYFWSWLKAPSLGDNGNAWFNMPLQTEFGVHVHEVHFTENGFPQLNTEQGASVVYGCEVIAREIAGEPDPELGVQFFESDLFGGNPLNAAEFDRLINVVYPGN